jgi:L-amino acid N-acyltransferase YncA
MLARSVRPSGSCDAAEARHAARRRCHRGDLQSGRRRFGSVVRTGAARCCGDGVPWIVCEAAHGVLGFAYAGRHRDRPAYRWSVEVSAYVRADARRAGVGRALYTSLLALLGVQGFRNVYAGIALPNDASMALHRAVGFESIGVYRNVGYKHGAWHAVEWFALTLGAHDPDPAPPTPLPELLGRAALQDAFDAGTSLIRV